MRWSYRIWSYDLVWTNAIGGTRDFGTKESMGYLHYDPGLGRDRECIKLEYRIGKRIMDAWIGIAPVLWAFDDSVSQGIMNNGLGRVFMAFSMPN